MDKVLSATVTVWPKEGGVPQGLEDRLERAVVMALVQASSIARLDGYARRLVLMATGSRLEVPLDWMSSKMNTDPLLMVSGVVTNNRDARKVDGHLVHQRADKDARRWLFLAGIDPFEFNSAFGIFSDPIVEQAGFISTPKSLVRQTRKNILGFKD